MNVEVSVPPDRTVDYYKTVEKTMGEHTTTEEFFRLFMIPGMNHCWGGAGANHFDFLSYLENWVESGRAPDKLVGIHLDTDHVFFGYGSFFLRSMPKRTTVSDRSSLKIRE